MLHQVSCESVSVAYLSSEGLSVVEDSLISLSRQDVKLILLSFVLVWGFPKRTVFIWLQIEEGTSATVTVNSY